MSTVTDREALMISGNQSLDITSWSEHEILLIGEILLTVMLLLLLVMLVILRRGRAPGTIGAIVGSIIGLLTAALKPLNSGKQDEWKEFLVMGLVFGVCTGIFLGLLIRRLKYRAPEAQAQSIVTDKTTNRHP